MNENVLVVKTEKLFPSGIWEGFRQFKTDEILSVVDKWGEYRPRGKVEDDGSFQQIIPQIALIVEDKIFLHKIPTTGSEDRLHEMWPIFLGGHVTEEDLGIKEAAEREFREEINYHGKIVKREFLGVVKLHDNLVNRVHTGLVWVYHGDTEDFSKTEDDGLIDGCFLSW